MSAEKWFALHYPSIARNTCTTGIAKRLSLVTSIIFFVYNWQWIFLKNTIENSSGHKICSTNNENYEIILYIVDAFIAAYIPIISMVIFNTAIIVKLCGSKAKSEDAVIGKSLSKIAKQSTIMLITVSMVFIVLNIPLYTYIAAVGITGHSMILACLAQLVYLNNGINAILYMLSGSKYRKNAMKMLRCHKSNKVTVSEKTQETNTHVSVIGKRGSTIIIPMQTSTNKIK